MEREVFFRLRFVDLLREVVDFLEVRLPRTVLIPVMSQAEKK
jgi:hypothetical protein